MDDLFYKRNGFRDGQSVEITVRLAAPYELRSALVEIAYGAGFIPSKLREIVCHVLKKGPDICRHD